MKLRHGLGIWLALVLAPACMGDDGVGGDSEDEGAEFALSAQVTPAIVDLSGAPDTSVTIPEHLVTPAQASNIGPGSHILITIPNEGTFGCTANFVWKSGTKRYLGAAGHCFLPPDKSATHGAGRDYDASRVIVKVCVSNCSFGGVSGFLITGNLVQLGRVAYARQSRDGQDIGEDFGVVEIPSGLWSKIRTSMPVFGGPTTATAATVGRCTMLCHYGNGVVVGESFATMARAGVGLGSNTRYWAAELASAPGDSGSSVQTCATDGSGMHGWAPVGVLTHLGIDFSITTAGLVFGTTVRRAIELGREASLSLALLPGQ